MKIELNEKELEIIRKCFLARKIELEYYREDLDMSDEEIEICEKETDEVEKKFLTLFNNYFKIIFIS